MNGFIYKIGINQDTIHVEKVDYIVQQKNISIIFQIKLMEKISIK